jgi:uncharacterized protein (TIGR01244 family)
MTWRTLDPDTFVSGQIYPGDVAEAAAQGVATIINNRPDGEEPGQPAGAEIEAAATVAGIAYRHIPVAGGLPAAQIDAMASALAEAPGKVLAYCKSGTRSTYLWALASAQNGKDGDMLISQAAAAGYDLSPLAAHLRR